MVFIFLGDKPVVQAAETAVREIVARSKMDTVLYEGREKIGVDLANSIQKILDSYKTGIYVTSVTVQNVQPPEQVQAAFDDAVKAGQDQERLKSEGQAYANDIIPRARGSAAWPPACRPWAACRAQTTSAAWPCSVPARNTTIWSTSRSPSWNTCSSRCATATAW